MKKLVTMKLTTLILFSVTLSAFAAPFSNAPMPTQAYHTDSTVAQPAQPAASTAATAAPQTTTTPAVQQTAPQTQDYLSQPVVSDSQSEAAFEQATNEHIQNLSTSNQSMSTAIQTLNQNVTQLQQEVNILQTTQMQTAPVKPKHTAFLPVMNRHNLNSFIELGGVAAFLLLFGVLAGRMMRRSPRLATVSMAASHRVGDVLADDTKSEYDFMNTQAAIPAKLDLARSYIAMSDHDQARAVLKTVLEKGDEEHRLVAEALLNKIQQLQN